MLFDVGEKGGPAKTVRMLFKAPSGLPVPLLFSDPPYKLSRLSSLTDLQWTVRWNPLWLATNAESAMIGPHRIEPSMQHDVFICHASEDKDGLVRPLAAALKAEHIDVWYDEFSLRVGDSLRQSIDRGLAGARFGVVVLSPSFFKKSWTQWELNGLVSRMMRESRGLVLPIWHEVGPEDVGAYSPPLVDIHALQSRSGVASLCAKLLDVIRPTVSPLLVAKDELARLGWNPPPISDEWWLTIVEAQADYRWPYMASQGWRFPLPGGPEARSHGLSIAWTALQLDWQEEAGQLHICQTTHPDHVVAFINENPALAEACAKHPDIVANYAPQLLIPEFSGRFGQAFDELVAQSTLRIQREPDKRFPGATCERNYALRLPDFGMNPAHEVADKWIYGRGGDDSARHHHVTDYLFWLLSQDSRWMPQYVKELLLLGMREWTSWRLDLTCGDVWPRGVWEKISRSEASGNPLVEIATSGSGRGRLAITWTSGDPRRSWPHRGSFHRTRFYRRFI